MSSVLIDSSDMKEKMSEIDHLIAIHDDIAADHIQEEVENKTFPYVPLKDGYLQDSFHSKVVNIPPYLEMDLWYSSFSNNYYDYAAYQHEEFLHHPLKGTDHYMIKGISHVNVEALYAYHISKVL